MRLIKFCALLIFISNICIAQTNPAITRWLQNTSIMGRHYVSGNSTPIQDNVIANVQTVRYSSNWVYINTNGIPTYVTGPYLDGNPSLATSQNAIFKIPLNPTQNTGTATATNGGNIGIFVNGVALFDYRDGASWKCSTNSLAGGPLGGAGDGVWNRDAVVGERIGFDCSKGHPAMGNYHHHQNPSAFRLDLNVISTVCNLYLSDGLYAIDSTQHSPLLGFAYDGFPVYGAYGYKNADATGGIVRMKSSYAYRNITTRNTYANGTSVSCGPPVNSTYPLGYFREDYEYIPTSTSTPDYLDAHNGRFCITPEYPNGIYCYFATVNANWNSAYPYVVGPTFYGNKTALKVTSITEAVTTYPVNTTPSVYIAATSKNNCGGQVIFNSSIYNGGLVPSYQWKKNGGNVGTNSNTYSTSTLVNGDIITCLLTASTGIASSNIITMSCQSSATLTLNVFIEGFYAGNHLMAPVLYNCGLSSNATISDSITVELHSSVSPFSLVETKKGILNTNGTCSVIFSSSRIGSSYYIVLKHRNSLETWSSIPVLFSVATTYNFTNNQSSAFGGNLIRTSDNLNWAVFSGDISSDVTGLGQQDQLIESQDFLDMENAVSNILTGYIIQDITGDGTVESEDYIILENNVRFIVFTIHP